jgi:hypothetical protein
MVHRLTGWLYQRAARRPYLSTHRPVDIRTTPRRRRPEAAAA